MNSRFDVIVVGLGAVGSATLYHAARAGMRVLGIDQFEVPNERGSSHGETRLIRICYSEGARYVPLIERAAELWKELEGESGAEILTTTGTLSVGPPGSEIVEGALRTARECVLPHEALGAAEVHERFPEFCPPEDFVAIHDPAGGVLRPERAVAAHVETAMARGAMVHTEETLESWSSHEKHVDVVTNRGHYEAESLVLCVGPWSSQWLDIGTDFPVTRQVTAWVSPPEARVPALERIPTWRLESRDGGRFYGAPVLPGGRGLKVSGHDRGAPVDPNDLKPAEPEEVLSTLRRVASELLPAAGDQIAAVDACLYTNSADQTFVLDHHPREPGVVFAAGFSGQGFKFSAAVGEAVVEICRGKNPSVPLDWTRLRSFN